MWYVYIATLEDGRFYVGVSQQSLPALIRDHQLGLHSAYTRRQKLVRIDWIENQRDFQSARHREVQIKRWTHAKKHALVRGDIAALKRLSRSGHRRTS